MSLLVILVFSAMTIVPRPGAESFRGQMMLAAGGFFVAWLGLALWVRARQRAPGRSSLPKWLTRLLVFGGVVYLLAVFFCVLG